MMFKRVFSGVAVLVAIVVAVAWLSGWFESKIKPGKVELAAQRMRDIVKGIGHWITVGKVRFLDAVCWTPRKVDIVSIRLQ